MVSGLMSHSLPRPNRREDAVAVKLVDNAILGDDGIFGDWVWCEDRFAHGGGYYTRQAWVIVDNSTPFQHCAFVDEKPVWRRYCGLIEFVQFKSSSINKCTILGDLSFAKTG